MAATGTAPIQISLDPAISGAGTDELLSAILRANSRVSDLIFSPDGDYKFKFTGNSSPLKANPRAISPPTIRGALLLS